jgi:hypothetical protein
MEWGWVENILLENAYELVTKLESIRCTVLHPYGHNYSVTLQTTKVNALTRLRERGLAMLSFKLTVLCGLECVIRRTTEVVKIKYLACASLALASFPLVQN